MIVILDYGMGNVASILNMLKKIGAEAVISAEPEVAAKADKIILPGVGTFDAGMENLTRCGFKDVINEHVHKKGNPILGICLGMQMLGRRSEEGRTEGLGLIPFDNVRFSFPELSDLKIPHMGWDRIQICRSTNLTEGLDIPQRYYFVHSYHAVCDNEENVMCRCEYGYSFAAAVCKDNVYGVQFHPEKSHRYGMKLLENFAWRC